MRLQSSLPQHAPVRVNRHTGQTKNFRISNNFHSLTVSINEKEEQKIWALMTRERHAMYIHTYKYVMCASECVCVCVEWSGGKHNFIMNQSSIGFRIGNVTEWEKQNN